MDREGWRKSFEGQDSEMRYRVKIMMQEKLKPINEHYSRKVRGPPPLLQVNNSKKMKKYPINNRRNMKMNLTGVYKVQQ